LISALIRHLPNRLFKNGNLNIGDQILAIDGLDVTGMQYDAVMHYLHKALQTVTFTVTTKPTSNRHGKITEFEFRLENEKSPLIVSHFSQFKSISSQFRQMISNPSRQHYRHRPIRHHRRRRRRRRRQEQTTIHVRHIRVRIPYKLVT
jgi:hypothetical protein